MQVVTNSRGPPTAGGHEAKLQASPRYKELLEAKVPFAIGNQPLHEESEAVSKGPVGAQPLTVLGGSFWFLGEF